VAENTSVTESVTGIDAGSVPAHAAHLEYTRRLNQRKALAEQLQRRHFWLGNVRIAVFAGIVALAWIIGKMGRPSVYWLVALIALFIGLVVAHRQVVRAMTLARRAAGIYTRGLARMEDRWAGTGDTGDEFGAEFKDPLHLYAEDLDILGPASLFQLLSTARTNMGRQRLAQWLLNHAEVEEVRQRQLAVAELKDKLDLREDLSVTGESERIAAHPEALARWAREESGLKDAAWWYAILAAVSIAALVYAFLQSLAPFVVILVIEGSIMFQARHQLEKIFAGIDETHRDLDSLASLLRRIEAEKFTSPRLQELQSRLTVHGQPPSACIARLDTLADLADSRHNWFVRLFDVPLLYSMQVAFALERWRRTYGAAIEAWLDVVGEIEALASIAAYAYEHPDDPFPEFAPPGSEAHFEGQALGHPLLPATQCVRNDVTLGGPSQVLLVSGSNMSGKSTYLRVIGVNAVMAMMGAPVRAASLRLTPVSVVASMRVSDSLQKGVSHFYAEIQRLRQVVDVAGAQPALFLLDEVLQGTNSHDRRVGTEGVLRTLLRSGSIGLVTTHDLALTSLEQVFPDRFRNVHFQERFEDDRLSFDYRLRSGVVTTSNGLELMKSIGLDVS
jgi:hypothetical protein